MRFGDTAITAYQGLAILPSRVVSKDSFKSLLTWEKQFLAFANEQISPFSNGLKVKLRHGSPIGNRQKLNLLNRYPKPFS